MPATVLRGLTWGHRRAIAPLRASASAFTADNPDIVVDWAVRPLGAFEHQPFAEAVRGVDLIVFDHPHLGTIVDDGLLRPLDEALANVPGALDPDGYVGPSLASYRHADATWAVPVDGATLHAVVRPDLAERVGQPVPRRWADIPAYAGEARRSGLGVALAARGHHALLTVASLMANLGAPWPDRPGAPFDTGALGEAVGLIEGALAASGPELRAVSLASNAIDIHEAMAEPHGRIAYCPAAYGYATYGEPTIGLARLAFAPFPGADTPFFAGTALGGAGVGLTRGCAALEPATRYLRHLAADETQREVIARHGGQPARAGAWADVDLDVRFGGFFSAVRGTLEAAWTRPRFAGYPRLEQRLAALLTACLEGKVGVSETVAAIDHAMRDRA